MKIKFPYKNTCNANFVNLAPCRCGGGNSAASKRTSETYEETKDENNEPVNQENGRDSSEEEKRQLLQEDAEHEAQKEGEVNGEEQKTGEGEEQSNDQGVKDDGDKVEDATEVKVEGEQIQEGAVEAEKKDTEEEKTEECGIVNHCEDIENADENPAEGGDGEGEKLLKEEPEKQKEGESKKGKKKEGSRWICGLGKKSNKSEKKKTKEDKKGKKDKKNEVEERENDKEGLTENEKKLINGEDEGSQGEGKEEGKEEEKEEEANEEKRENGEGETESKEQQETEGAKSEEVVVFVTESEAVVEETHRTTEIVNVTETKEEFCVKGEGLVKGVKGEAATFEVHSKADDVFNFTCKVQDANGNEVAVEIEHVEGNHHKATYYPSSVGIHSIEAIWKGNPVIGSPFQVEVTE